MQFWNNRLLFHPWLVALFLATVCGLQSATTVVGRTFGSTAVVPQSLPFPMLLWSSISQNESNEYTIGSMDKNESIIQKDYELRFGGVARLYASMLVEHNHVETTTLRLLVMERLRKSVVTIIGVGGVGSWAAEAICRSGVGTIVLIDLDDVCISNTNRQLPALQSTIGQMKLDVLRERMLLINPNCQIILVHDFVTEENVKEIFHRIQTLLLGRRNESNSDLVSTNNTSISAVIDAIDGTKEKAAILATCRDMQIPVLTCGGAAGRRHIGSIQCCDLTEIQDDKLLASTKKRLRQRYDFPPGLPFSERQKGRKVQKWYIKGVFSDEIVATQPDDDNSSSQLQSWRQCDGNLGTACYVTGSFGFVAASQVVEQIALNQLRPPRKQRSS